jgi:hypothetical protein
VSANNLGPSLLDVQRDFARSSQEGHPAIPSTSNINLRLFQLLTACPTGCIGKDVRHSRGDELGFTRLQADGINLDVSAAGS